MYVCAEAGEVRASCYMFVQKEKKKSPFLSQFFPFPLLSLHHSPPSLPHINPRKSPLLPSPLPISPNCTIPYPTFFSHPLNPSIPSSPSPSPPPLLFLSDLIRRSPFSFFPSRPRNSPAAVPPFGSRDLKLRLPALFRPRGWLPFRAIWGFTRIRVSLVLAGAGWSNRIGVWD